MPNYDYVIIKTEDQTWEEAAISYNIFGLIVASLPPVARPKQRVQITEIDGRDGDIVTDLGWSAYDKQLRVGLYGDYNVDAVLNFFKPKGQVIFSDEPNRYFNYEIIDSIELERVIKFKKGTVTFHVQPYQYAKETQSISQTITTSTTDSQYIAAGQGDVSVNSHYVDIVAPDQTPLLNFMISLPYTGDKDSPWKRIGCSVYQNSELVRVDSMSFPTEDRYHVPIAEDKLFYGGVYDVLNRVLYHTIDRWGNAVDIRYAEREDLTNYPELPLINFDNIRLSNSYRTAIYVYKIDVDTAGNDNGQGSYPMPTFSVSYYSGNVTNINVINNGNTDALPIITVYGTGWVTLYNNGEYMCEMNINSSYITIDAEQMNAYKGNVSKNRYFNGDFDDIKLVVGNNVITWTGVVSQIDITYRPRWI